MPLELHMWRIDTDCIHVSPAEMTLEDRLEELLAREISIASPDWMVIGRQVATPWGKRIDLLCMDLLGNLVVLELKRDKTEREIIAQVLDYGSYVREIKSEDLPRLFAEYQNQYSTGQPIKSLEEAYRARFSMTEMPQELNNAHQLVIVAATLDAATERIVTYLAEVYDVSINAVFFRVFQDDGREYLTRVWLRDPRTAEDAEARGVRPPEKVPWNGEFYVNFEQSRHRDWEDAVRYNFVSAGFGAKARDAMLRLEKGNRIWVNVPGKGYVGVGEVVAPAIPVDRFMVQDDERKTIPITEAPHKATHIEEGLGDPDKVEHLVQMKWLHTVPVSQAVKERGFFGNQNVVACPRDAKWPYTVDRLKRRFGVS